MEATRLRAFGLIAMDDAGEHNRDPGSGPAPPLTLCPVLVALPQTQEPRKDA